jgi:hypothetical protein
MITLGACGGGGDDDAPTVNLQGLWYQRDATSFQAQYIAPHVITQNGRDVVVKACDMTTESLRLDGKQLYDKNGQLYWEQPGEGDFMAGGHYSQPRPEVRRLSSVPRFDSGRVSLGVAGTALQASQDVCAQEIGLRYTNTRGAEFDTAGILIAAPYMGSHLQLRLAFDTLHAGVFNVSNRTDFGHNPAGNTHVEAKSPAFVGSYGSDTLTIVGGQVKVEIPAQGRYTLEGTLNTANGAQIPFSADIVLKRPL